MMPRLSIDFSRTRVRPAPAGVVLLLAGCLVLATSGARFWQASTAHDLASSEYARATRKPVTKKHAAVPLSAAVLQAEKQNQAVLDKLTVPWQSLLAIVESYPAHDVALIGIDQNPGQRQIRITAEAKDAQAMLAYLNFLQHTALLHEALLSEHEIEAHAPGTPVRFQIAAIWGSHDQSPVK